VATGTARLRRTRRHRGEILGGTGPEDELTTAVHEGLSTEVGPQMIADAAAIVFRRYCCPSCWTTLYPAVVPADHPDVLRTLGKATVASAM
jgi:N-methylhydantoinase B